MAMKQTGSRIRICRESLGLTQEELARRLGYRSKSTVNKVEMGINDVSLTKIQSYAKALHVSPSYLMGWTDEHARTYQGLTEDEIFDAFLNAEKLDRDYILHILHLKTPDKRSKKPEA